MQQFPPNPPKKGPRPTPADANAALFSTGQHHVASAPELATRRTDRGARIFSDFKRALLFLLVLVAVGFILYEFATIAF